MRFSSSFHLARSAERSSLAHVSFRDFVDFSMLSLERSGTTRGDACLRRCCSASLATMRASQVETLASPRSCRWRRTP
jgi:hypothetical protein